MNIIVEIDNVSLTDTNIQNKDSSGIVYVTNVPGGYCTLSNFSVTNSNLNFKPAFQYWDSAAGNVTITNVNVNNVTLGTSSSIVKVEGVYNFSINNASFVMVTQTDPTDSSGRLIDVKEYDLSKSGQFEIEGITVANSSVSLFQLNSFKNSPSAPKSLEMSNIVYKESIVSYQNSLIAFEKIEISSNFSINLSRIEMSDITFPRTGNLIVFGQQIGSTLQMSD